ncbi:MULTISPECIES: hypothetical protein [unclassified Streptomyces]|uniref:hypothetical protein n=1 Tax=unclassified Streptomyces TaxID=2593676 RepID=UPI0033C697BE
MKYIKTAWDDELQGFFTDARAYLAALPEFAEALPPGARAFASDAEHYRRDAACCVKDLELSEIRIATDKSGTLTLVFAPNQWKHETGLRIAYEGVVRFSVSYDHGIDWMRCDAVLLDEILPADDGGCVHEIALTDATITVHARDLRADWEATPGDVARGTGGPR